MGQSVTGGVLNFLPQSSEGKPDPGKPASGEIGKDGTYSLSTNDVNDGAVVGRHVITFQPPPVEVVADPTKPFGPNEGPPPSPYAGLVPKPGEAEVKKGANQIDIELVPAVPK